MERYFISKLFFFRTEKDKNKKLDSVLSVFEQDLKDRKPQKLLGFLQYAIILCSRSNDDKRKVRMIKKAAVKNEKEFDILNIIR